MLESKTFKNKKQDISKKNREIIALFFVLVLFFGVYVFALPTKSGILGRVFSNVMLSMFGTGSYFLPLLFLQYFIIRLRQSVNSRKKFYFIWSTIFFVSATVLFEAIHFMFISKVYGGWVGDRLYMFFSKLFGTWLCLGMVIIIFFFSVKMILKYSTISYIYDFLRKLKVSLVRLKDTRVQNVRQKSKTKLILKDDFASKISKCEFIRPNIIISEQEKKEYKKSSNFVRMISDHGKADSRVFDYRLPPIDLLNIESPASFDMNKNDFFERAELLRKTLVDFDINAEVKDIIPGPVVTRYDLVLAPGVRIQALSNIVDNISLVMRTSSIRVIPVPEKAAVGIEVPNPSSVSVGLGGILGSNVFKSSKSLITLAFGKTTDGFAYVTNLTSMPHLLIAGATGSGKSVGIHSIILSILYKARPDEVKFMLIDPKRVEMSIYKDIPHIYNPCTYATDAGVITNPKEAAKALKKLVVVMEERYAKFARQMVRNIEEYNDKMSSIGGEKEFYIIVIVDEFADLMLMIQKEVEDSIQRLAQMARAIGIHLILATQRPSVNVITGTIKANFPARLSFQTTSKIDSRVILDMLGAECLIGRGDMLFLPPGEAKPIRLQGAYVSLKEVERIVSFINNQKFPRIYEPIVVEVEGKNGSYENEDEGVKDLVPALKLISERRRVSQDLLKANFGGSARATNILSILEIKGFITKPNGTNKWQIDYSKIANYLKDEIGKN